MNGRRALFGLLVLVAAAAAVLSFSALRDLALVCGFDDRLAWLLPVVIDAGAAAGSLVWLGAWPPTEARRFARVLALLLLCGSVAGNALGHGLEAFGLAASWWVVVAVSAIPPAVLGAVVHLAVLAADRDPGPAQDPAEPGPDQQPAESDQSADGPDQADQSTDQPEPRSGPSARPRKSDDEVVAELLARPDGLPEVKDLRVEYGMGWNRADRLVRAAQARLVPASTHPDDQLQEATR